MVVRRWDCEHEQGGFGEWDSKVLGVQKHVSHPVKGGPERQYAAVKAGQIGRFWMQGDDGWTRRVLVSEE